MSIARVRVELKPGVRYDERAFRMMFQDFKKKCSDAGIMHTYKEHQYFESKAVKERRKRRDCINKMQQDIIEQKLSHGEKVHCSSKLIKKIRAKQAKVNRRTKDGKSSRGFNDQ